MNDLTERSVSEQRIIRAQAIIRRSGVRCFMPAGVQMLPQAVLASDTTGPGLFWINVLASPAIVNTIVCTEQSVTVTGVRVTDILVALNKPTINGAIAAVSGRCAANAIMFTFCNPTAGNVTPTAAEVYKALIFRPAL